MLDLLYFFIGLVHLVASGELDVRGVNARSVGGVRIGVRIDAEVGGVAAEVGVDNAGVVVVVVVVVVDVGVIVDDVVGVVGIVVVDGVVVADVVVVVVAVGNVAQSIGDERLKVVGG